MKFRMNLTCIFLFSFCFIHFSYAANPSWVVDGSGSTQVTYNFGSYALGGPLDSENHTIKITGSGTNSVIISLPTNCKIGVTLVSLANTYFVANGTQYSTNTNINTNVFTGQGATTAIRFLNVASNTGGVVTCIGGSLTLSY